MLTVGSRIVTFDIDLNKAKTKLADAMARNVAYRKRIASLKAERESLKGEIKKLKTAFDEKDKLLAASEESYGVFFDMVDTLR